MDYVDILSRFRRTATPPSSAARTRETPRRHFVLHATWLPSPQGGKPFLALWGEAETKPPRNRHWVEEVRPVAQPRTHAFAAKYEELVVALERLWRVSRPGVTPRKAHTHSRLALWLPARGPRPIPSPELVRAGWAGIPAEASTESAGGQHDTLDAVAALDAPSLLLYRVPAALLDAEAAATLLAGLPLAVDLPLTFDDEASAEGPGELRLGSDLRFWAAASAFALDLLVRQRFLPGVRELPEEQSYFFFYPSYGGARSFTPGPSLSSTWQAALGEPDVRPTFDALTAAMPDLCRAAVPASEDDPANSSPTAPSELLEDFLHTAVNARITTWLAQTSTWISVPPQPSPQGSRINARGSGYYPAYGAYGYYATRQSLAARWLQGLSRGREPLSLTSDETRMLQEGLRRWHAGLSGATSPTFRLCFRLSPPVAPGIAEEAADEHHDEHGGGHHNGGHDGYEQAGEAAPVVPGSGNGHAQVASELGNNGATAATTAPVTSLLSLWRLDFLLQARDDPSLLVPLEEVWRERGAVATFLDRRFDHPHEHVLTGLGQAAQLFEPLALSLTQERPTECLLSGAEAYLFLRDALPKLEEAGFGVLAPPWWKRNAVKPTVRLKLKGAQTTSTGLMGLGAIVGFDYKVALGGAELSREELERLAALKEPLVRLRGQWVELRPEQVEAALRFVDEHGGTTGTMSLGEALRVSLTGELDGARDEEDGGGERVELEEISADGWIGDLLGRLRAGETVGEVEQPASLQGTLRPYQLRGLGWMSFLSQYGLGACLADDMGLGKSAEFLALMLRLKEVDQLTAPVLLVCPTSVVGNWEHEAARFAPDLRVLTHHGAQRVGRKKAHTFADEVAKHDLVLTTYSLLPRDEKTLAGVEWSIVALDEAQNIKNAEAKQSRAARKLRAPMRVALTGTPVENRLSELWSILDFLNPGFLGSQRRFTKRFAVPIELQHDQAATQALQSLVRPFILRRLKTDPTVIQDLPEKIEMREYCTLTREQATLYQAVVRDGLRKLEEAAEPMQRRGVILAMLSKLKQVCNHPAHFLGDNSDLPGRSGKLQRLEELVEELLAEGDRALIFTQFTEMGNRLQPYLQERFGREVLYLHGGVPQRQRVKLVERFQAEDGPPLFLLSLKAGGTGLNLTHANQVIHFDRWWNPAVENQATDRAFRIGQTRNVQVRKLVCQGTLEERIDMMIEEKRGLAEQVIGAGEAWLTELSSTELRDLFSLRASALAE